MRYLVFTLYAPIGSFGDIAVGERRMSWARPGRSAILGMLAAAQGFERENEDAHQKLESGLFYAVRTDAPGRPLIDYHTAQSPKARRGRRYATRREELESDDLNTILSTREWRMDSYFTVALWLRPDSHLDLEVIMNSLCRPRFALYVGRKSGPPGLPLNPEIIEADTFMDAFDARNPNEIELEVLEHIRSSSAMQCSIAFDEDVQPAPTNTRVERRRDALVSRTRWQFTDRLEHVLVEESGES